MPIMALMVYILARIMLVIPSNRWRLPVEKIFLNRMPRIKPNQIFPLLLSAFLLSGCSNELSVFNFSKALKTAPPSAQDSDDANTIQAAAAATQAITQPKVKIVPTITGMGYASVSSQPAKSINQKRLMAIRTARLDAMRNLTEQVHGMQINSRTTVIDAVMQNDSLRATVDGLILGAKTVRINPVGTDTYEVVLELDRALIDAIMRAASA